MTTERHQKLRAHVVALGELLVEKQQQYGDSVGSTGAILRELYPDGIRPDQYDNLQLVVRVLDKLKRIASQGPDGTDRGGESPWRDIGGYGILGLAQAEHTLAADARTSASDAETTARDVLYRLVVELGLFDSAHAFEDGVWGAARAPASVNEISAWILAAVRDGVLDRGNADWIRKRVLARASEWRVPATRSTAVSCRGCKHAVEESPSPLLKDLAYCRKTNRPSVTARVDVDGPRPTWCPGFEAQP